MLTIAREHGPEMVCWYQPSRSGLAASFKAVAYKNDGPDTVAGPPGRVELSLLTKGQQEAVEHAEHPRIPALVLQVQKAVDSIAAQQRKEDP